MIIDNKIKLFTIESASALLQGWSTNNNRQALMADLVVEFPEKPSNGGYESPHSFRVIKSNLGLDGAYYSKSFVDNLIAIQKQVQADMQEEIDHLRNQIILQNQMATYKQYPWWKQIFLKHKNNGK